MKSLEELRKERSEMQHENTDGAEIIFECLETMFTVMGWLLLTPFRWIAKWRKE